MTRSTSRRSSRTRALRLLLALVLLGGLAGAQPAAGALTATDVGGTFVKPIFAAAPPGDGERLMVVLRDGSIRVVRNGVTLTQPFLTIPDVDTTGEGGLLSMAFPPDYVASGRFYVYMVRDDADPGVPPHSPIEIREYRRSAANPDIADPATRRTVLTIPHPDGANHYGGTLHFGPDGLLYASVGDGAVSGNAPDTFQRLGKLLRLDPRPLGAAPLRVPAGNPFAGGGGDPLVYSTGLRNPFRFSFDRQTGDLVIGDVGQNKFEEIDFRPSAQGRGLGTDFGWPTCEGFGHPADDDPCTTDTLPVYDYSPAGCASVTGGVVVRDPGLEELLGKYLFGDYCDTYIKSLQLGLPVATGETTLSVAVPGFQLVAFGEDACGRVHVVLMADAGKVRRLGDEVPSPCNLRVNYSAAPASVAGRRLVFRLGGSRRQRPLRSGHISVRVRCNAACSVRALGRLSLKRKGKRIRLRQALGRRASAGTLTLRLKMSARTRKTLRRALRARRRVRAGLTVRVRDGARKLFVRKRVVRLVR